MKRKQKLDTPRTGKAWCDVVNKEPLPPSIIGRMTLEGIRDAQRGYRYDGQGNRIPVPQPVADPIGAIIAGQKEDRERAAREVIFARMRR